MKFSEEYQRWINDVVTELLDGMTIEELFASDDFLEVFVGLNWDERELTLFYAYMVSQQRQLIIAVNNHDDNAQKQFVDMMYLWKWRATLAKKELEIIKKLIEKNALVIDPTDRESVEKLSNKLALMPQLYAAEENIRRSNPDLSEDQINEIMNDFIDHLKAGDR